MKKQLLLFLALISVANASAIDFKFTPEALSALVSHENTPFVVGSATFSLILLYTLYKFYADGGYENNPMVESERVSTPDFMKPEYDFPFGRLSDPSYQGKPFKKRIS